MLQTIRDQIKNTAEVNGRVLDVNGFRVFANKGKTPYECGLAHGYLLAESICECIESITSAFGLQSIVPPMGLFLSNQFKLGDNVEAECQGIRDGMVAKLGDNMRYSLLDIQALNYFADWIGLFAEHGIACSGFSTFGHASDVIHARSLDFPVGKKAIDNQTIFVNGPGDGFISYVSIGWPGMVASFTGINHQGVSACIHDSYNVPRSAVAGTTRPQQVIPRGVIARYILQTSDLEDCKENAFEKMHAANALCGTMLHMAWPIDRSDEDVDGTNVPMAVIESSPNRVESRKRKGNCYFIVTNDSASGIPTSLCPRAEAILKSRHFSSKEYGTSIELAQEALIAAQQDIATHSVYFLPDSMTMWLSYTTWGIPSPSVKPTKFDLNELFSLRYS